MLSDNFIHTIETLTLTEILNFSEVIYENIKKKVNPSGEIISENSFNIRVISTEEGQIRIDIELILKENRSRSVYPSFDERIITHSTNDWLSQKKNFKLGIFKKYLTLSFRQLGAEWELCIESNVLMKSKIKNAFIYTTAKYAAYRVFEIFADYFPSFDFDTKKIFPLCEVLGTLHLNQLNLLMNTVKLIDQDLKFCSLDTLAGL